MIEKFRKDLKTAMKEGNAVKKSTLQLLIAGYLNEQKLKSPKMDKPLTNSEELKVVNRELKQTKESLEEFKKAGRTDLAEDAEARIKVILSYLPTQMPIDEVEKIIITTIAEKGIDINKGDIMKNVMPLLAGKIDSKSISTIVDKIIKEK